MRIALLNATEAWGGGEQWFFDAATALAEREHDVRLVAAEGSELFRRFRKHKAADAHPAAESGHASLFPAQRLSDALTKDPVPEVAVCNSGRELRAAQRAVGRRTEIRFVLRRGIDRPLHDHWFRRGSWKRLAAILVNSDATGRTVKQSLRWFPDDRIRKLYNAVRFEPAPRVESTGETFRLGAVARMVRQKGLEYLIEAVAKLDDDIAWSLEIAGDGKLRPSLESLAAQRGLGDRVRFLGHAPDLPPLYARWDAVVIPSLYEGFCFVAAEAALAGLPVIASNTSSLPEIVLEGKTGLLIPVRDAAAIADAIRTLAGDRNRAAEMGEAARASARERFSSTHIHDELVEILEWARVLDPVGSRRADS